MMHYGVASSSFVYRILKWASPRELEENKRGLEE
jgi:hypothetical protein